MYLILRGRPSSPAHPYPIRGELPTSQALLYEFSGFSSGTVRKSDRCKRAAAPGLDDQVREERTTPHYDLGDMFVARQKGEARQLPEREGAIGGEHSSTMMNTAPFAPLLLVADPVAPSFVAEE